MNEVNPFDPTTWTPLEELLIFAQRNMRAAETEQESERYWQESRRIQALLSAGQLYEIPY